MLVLKRIRGKTGYYYLKHCFRKGTKVITQEKYLGKAIPKNIEEIKAAFGNECHAADLLGLFEKIKSGFQKEFQHYPASIKEKVKEQIAIAFTYNSNAIEGSKITLAETREIIEQKIAPNKPLKDIKESEAHARVFLNMLSNKEQFGLPLILKWHRDLFKNTKQDIAGSFRDYLVRVGDYLAPDWQDVKKLISNLVKFYRNNKRMNAVELSARMHYRFEKIHPFGDGNGRVGRLIMNYILWWSGYPMLIIEYKKRKSYYHALSRDEEFFFHYFARRYLSVHRKYLK